MNRAVLLLVAATVVPLLAGCLGYPPDAARWGDRVTVRYDAVDLDTGETVATANVTQVELGPDSALGLGAARAIVGHRPNETVEVELRDDPALRFTGVKDAPALFQRVEPEVYPVADIFRTPPTVGTVATVRDEFQRPVLVDVLALADGNVTIRRVLQGSDYPQFGLQLHVESDGEARVMKVRPLPSTPAFAGPLGSYLPDHGTYRARGVEGDRVLFDYTPVTDSALVGRDVLLRITVVSAERGPAPEPEPGYQGRSAPGTAFAPADAH